MRIDPKFYREKATETVKRSKKAKDKKTRAYLLAVAEEYTKLADEAELPT